MEVLKIIKKSRGERERERGLKEGRNGNKDFCRIWTLGIVALL